MPPLQTATPSTATKPRVAAIPTCLLRLLATSLAFVVFAAPARTASAAATSPNRCLQLLSGSASSGSRCNRLSGVLYSYDWRNSPGLAVVRRSDPPPPNDLVRTARRFLGTPYSWGGVDEQGFDCSGFVNRVYALNGYDLPRTSREQFRVGLFVDRQDLRTGDLLFFVDRPGGSRIIHVGMYVGDGEFIHASSGKGLVTFDRLDSSWYSTRFIGGRRVTVLPPGRYSTAGGGARAGFALESKAQVPQASARAQVATADVPSSTDSADLLTEHTSTDRPPQIAASLDRGALTRVGPDLLLPPATALGVRLGTGFMDGDWSLIAVPEFSWFGHRNAFQIAIAAPFELPLTTSGNPSRSQWSSVRDWLRIIREVSFGQKESNLYLDVGRTTSASLGHGQLMRYFTPNIASRYLPRHGLGADALTLSFDGKLDGAGFELMLDDVTRPGVVGAVLWTSPGTLAGSKSGFWRNLSLGFTYAGDWNAVAEWREREPGAEDGETSHAGLKPEHSTVHAAGASLELKLADRHRFALTTYLDGSGLLHSNGVGVGGAVGTLMRANVGGRKSHALRLRLEGRLSGPGFLPSYFDATYALDGVQPSSLAAARLTRLQLLERLSHGPSRWSVYGEASWRYARIAEAGFSYEGGRELESLPSDPSRVRVGHNAMAFLGIRELYLPDTRKPIRLRVSWHLRNLHFDSISYERPEHYLFASASVAVFRWLSVAGAIRYALSANSTDPGTVDGVVELATGWEF